MTAKEELAGRLLEDAKFIEAYNIISQSKGVAGNLREAAAALTEAGAGEAEPVAWRFYCSFCDLKFNSLQCPSCGSVNGAANNYVSLASPPPVQPVMAASPIAPAAPSAPAGDWKANSHWYDMYCVARDEIAALRAALQPAEQPDDLRIEADNWRIDALRFKARAEAAEAEADRLRAAVEQLRQPDYFGGLVERARQAAAKASVKFPQPNYVTLKIAEEAGEVVRGAVHYAEKRMEWSEVEGEIVQLLAMLIRFVTEGDQVNGVIPPTQEPKP